MPQIRFRLNGVDTSVDVDPDRPLLDVLRSEFALAGPHFGCGAGECGACNVIVGDRAVSSCDMVSCFPVKIERASAGWTRAVAILDG